MNCVKEARTLANYIDTLGIADREYQPNLDVSYTHIGALLTDIVLQAGVNYKSVVAPRVKKVLLNYSDANTISKFKQIIGQEGLSNILSWNHNVKLDRFTRLIEFCTENSIESCSELKLYLSTKNNQQNFLSINGVGPKTLDYLMKLLSFDTVAVDRHIYSFVELADINVEGYELTKKVVEYAADFLNISRTSIDYSIWKYMSNRDYLKSQLQLQLELDFS